ncbi:MAG TPA: hypothetical protein VMF64_10080, partial [Steroidobacteraceae bacterium]|nr:hypothetical protein [Steroidobacteraceae bacterium]
AGALALAGASAGFASETRSYVLSSLTDAAYSTKDDCQGGIDPDQYVQYGLDLAAQGMPQEQIKQIMTAYLRGGVVKQLVNRGRIDGRPVNAYSNPQAVADPRLHLVDGRYAYGFNLDGKGANSPNSFEDPVTHEVGVDNQLFRVFGCHKNFRGPPAEAAPPTYYSAEWSQARPTFPAWVITISGDDLSRDGAVSVSIERSLDHVLLDAQGNTEAYTSFRSDPDPGSRNVFQGRLEHGVVTITDHHDFHLIGDPIVMNDLDLSHTHFRMTLGADGHAEGIIGGYQPWMEIFLPFGQGGAGFENMQGIDVPGLYWALRRLADADPDPVTGQNRRISVAWQFTAVPAFVLPAASPVSSPVPAAAQAGALASGHGLAGPTASGSAQIATPPGITLQVLGRGQGYGRMSFIGLAELPRDQIAFADARGMTLYTYGKDSPGRSRCTAACSQVWIPALAPSYARAVGEWSTFNRGPGQRQWQYRGKPVYTFVRDTDIGSLFGVSPSRAQVRPFKTGSQAHEEGGRQGAGNNQEGSPLSEWHPVLLFPDTAIAMPDTIAVREVGDADGLVFVDQAGMTLYTYEGRGGAKALVRLADQTEWRPLVAPALAHPVGEWSVLTRSDGIRQWAFRGKPLFTYARDLASGDANGVGLSRDWDAARVVSFYMPAQVRLVQTPGRGKVLSTAEGMTLYRRDAIPMDFGGGQSTRHGVPIQPGVGREIGVSLKGCEGACLTSWHPFVAPADAHPDGFWDVAIRPDGVHQWVYQGYALYTYAGDHEPGEIAGNDIFNAVLSGNPGQLNTVGTAMFGTANLYWTIAYP